MQSLTIRFAVMASPPRRAQRWTRARLPNQLGFVRLDTLGIASSGEFPGWRRPVVGPIRVDRQPSPTKRTEGKLELEGRRSHNPSIRHRLFLSNEMHTGCRSRNGLAISSDEAELPQGGPVESPLVWHVCTCHQCRLKPIDHRSSRGQLVGGAIRYRQ